MADKATRKTLDFTNVKEGGGINPKRMPAGDYKAKIIEVREEKVSSGDNKGRDMWNFVFQLVDHKTATYPYRCTLVENQLWKVRNVLVAAGKTVPKKRVAVDPNNLVGAVVGISLDDDEYDGREKSDIEAIFPAADLDEEDDDVDEDADAASDEDEADDESEVEDLDSL